MNQATMVVMTFLSTMALLESTDRPVHELLDECLGPLKRNGPTLVDRALAVFREQVNEARIEFAINTAKLVKNLEEQGLEFVHERPLFGRDEQDTRFLIQVLPDVVLEYHLRFGADSTLRAVKSDTLKLSPSAGHHLFDDAVICGPNGVVDLIDYIVRNKPTSVPLERVCAITGGRHELMPQFEILRELLSLRYALPA